MLVKFCSKFSLSLMRCVCLMVMTHDDEKSLANRSKLLCYTYCLFESQARSHVTVTAVIRVDRVDDQTHQTHQTHHSCLRCTLSHHHHSTQLCLQPTHGSSPASSRHRARDLRRGLRWLKRRKPNSSSHCVYTNSYSSASTTLQALASGQSFTTSHSSAGVRASCCILQYLTPHQLLS